MILSAPVKPFQMWLKKLLGLLLLFSLLVTACQQANIVAVQSPTATDAPVASATLVEATSTLAFTDTPGPTFTASPTSPPTETPTPSAAEILEGVRKNLEQVILAEDLTALGMSEARAAQWMSFAKGQNDLSQNELELVEKFLSEWETLNTLTETAPVPSTAKPVFRISEFENPGAAPGLAVYAIDQDSSTQDGTERLFLLGKDDSQPKVLVLSQKIEGLTQRISQDGCYVEYVDEAGEWLIKTDALLLDQSTTSQQMLQQWLAKNDLARYYISRSAYPRYYFNIPGVESSFYALEKLPYKQILLLKDTLELFGQDKLVGLRDAIFAPTEDVRYVISREPHALAAALAQALGGTPRKGIIVLFSKNLFDNKYETADAIAHEAVHIWQGKAVSCDYPKKRLSREIGNQVITSEFYNWTAEELIKAAKNNEIGAYHVSMWVASQFKQQRLVRWYQDIIRTGRANDRWVSGCE